MPILLIYQNLPLLFLSANKPEFHISVYKQFTGVQPKLMTLDYNLKKCNRR